MRAHGVIQSEGLGGPGARLCLVHAAEGRFLLRKPAVARVLHVTHPKIMTTKVALLPRILPGLFHLPTAATPAGYRMPHERYFVYAAAFSALLHVAVLYGFRTPPPPPPHGGPDAGGDVGRLWEDRTIAVELPPPPPPVASATNKPDKPTDPAETETGASRATIPELLSPLIPGLVTIDGDLNPNGVAPIKGSLRWEVPKNPVAAGPRSPKGLVPLEDLDEKPVATNRIAPRYPAEMRRNGTEGVAVLRFVVDSHGEVTDVEIVRADAVEFGRAGAEAMLRWKFKPGMKNRRRVDTRMEMPMSFTMEKGV